MIATAKGTKPTATQSSLVQNRISDLTGWAKTDNTHLSRFICEELRDFPNGNRLTLVPTQMLVSSH